MSTFSGKIQEIPHISVDRFDENNLNSEAYFLSHCHSDHMVGLHTSNFQYNLLKNEKFLYSSEISCAILTRRFPQLKNNVKVLDKYAPTTIILKNGNILVYTISAGHCPGSVMFLFETDINILYTGDYRIHKHDTRKFKSFYDMYKQVKVIEKIYLDTTFFLKSYLQFPKREESLKEVCKIIKDWTEKGKKYCVKLLTCARYGYEYIFKEIYKETGTPVHVDKISYDFYSVIPEMDNAVTMDCTATQIHCSCGSSFQSVCYKAFSSELRTIKISAFRWTQDILEEGLSCDSDNMHFVCYSTHASYEEGVELLRFLKPKSVEICVKHDSLETNKEMFELIEEVLNEFKPETENKFKHKLFETEISVSEETVEKETSFDFKILDSPPRNPRRLKKSFHVNKEASTCRVKEELSLSKMNATEFCSVKIQCTEEDSDSLIIEKQVELEDIVNIEAYPIKRLKF